MPDLDRDGEYIVQVDIRFTQPRGATLQVRTDYTVRGYPGGEETHRAQILKELVDTYSTVKNSGGMWTWTDVRDRVGAVVVDPTHVAMFGVHITRVPTQDDAPAVVGEGVGGPVGSAGVDLDRVGDQVGGDGPDPAVPGPPDLHIQPAPAPEPAGDPGPIGQL